MTLTLSPEIVLTVIGIGMTCGTALFHGILYIGKLTNRVDRHEDRLDDHGNRLDGHDRDINTFKGMGV